MSMLPITVLLIFVPAFCAIFGGWIWIHRRLSRPRVEALIREKGLSVAKIEYRIFRRGPFSFLGAYAVYRITRVDGPGLVRIGWVRIGDFLSGVFSDEVELLWEPA